MNLYDSIFILGVCWGYIMFYFLTSITNHYTKNRYIDGYKEGLAMALMVRKKLR